MSDLERQLAKLDAGDHIVHIFDERSERDDVLVAFAKVGLRRGAAVCLALDDETIPVVESALGSGGLDVEEARSREALELISFSRLRESDAAAGLGDVPDEVGRLARRLRDSEHAGFWFAGAGPSGGQIAAAGDELLDFEIRLDEMVEEEGLSMVCLCLLDRSGQPPAVVRRVLRTHRRVIVEGVLHVNPFYRPPEANRIGFREEDQVDWMMRQLERTVGNEGEIRRQRRSIEALVENSPDVIARFDRGRRHLYVNPVVEEEFGIPPGEMVGKTHEELDTPPEIAERWREALDRVLETASGEEVVIQYPTPDGLKSYQCRLEAEIGPGDEVESVFCIARDVTRQRRTRKELEEKTDQLQERIKELGCLYEVLRVLQPRDRPLEERLGRVVELIPQGWKYPEVTAARIVVDDREFVSEGYEPAAWTQRADIDLNGGDTVGHVEIVVFEEYPAEDDGPFLREEQELIEAIADRVASAVEEHRAEERRNRSDSRFRSLIENTSDVITIVERDGTIRYHSPALRRVLGYEPEDRVGHRLEENIHEDDRSRALAAFNRLVEDPDLTPRVEYRIRHADGSWRTAESVGHNLLDDPSVNGVVIISRDITERKRIETERERLEQRLQQAQRMEAIGRLAGGIAHDFNNLLTVIDGHVTFLLEEAELDDAAREDAEAIQAAARRASDLTRQLLAFSRSQVLKPKVLDPGSVIHGIDSFLQRLIGEDVELEIEIRPDVGRIEADPTQLEQVVLNLAVNARDAMPEGGELAIRLRRIELPADRAGRIPDLDPGPYVQIVVSDTGEGIPPEDQERIFEPFFTTKEMGSGLGLATAYGIVKQSGGHISVQSVVGVGTTFVVFFPEVESEAPEGEEGFEQRLPLGGGETVLLAEDEDSVRELARRVLEQAGYRVLVAASGVRAVELVEEMEEPVDLVLTDVVMPEMSGKELADRIEEEWPGTRVLYMSGYTDDAISSRGVLGLGVSFLQKPFTPRQLVKAVREVLDQDD